MSTTTETLTIPAITLIQPWASLIAVGAKRFETRSWCAPAALIGRTVAIHAGKNRTEGADLIDDIFAVWETLPIVGYRIHNDSALDLPVVDDTVDEDGCIAANRAFTRSGVSGKAAVPYGAVVGTARLVACRRTETVADLPEAVFGEFSPGRWAWELDGVTPLNPPVSCRGYQVRGR